jgi:ABC-2 type transport system ATP-binding protein
LNDVVSTNGLTKNYGRIQAVNHLTFSIPQNSVFGILGPNGSGKTTTLGMMLNVVRPSSGSYLWFGEEPNEKSLQKIGSILESPSFYPYLSAVDNLRIIAEIKHNGYHNIDEVLKITGIFDRRHSAFRTYSLGMKQRLALAAALLSDPSVLILDEPTNGLDPKGIAEIRIIIKTIAQQGKTIILASHMLDEVQKVCSHFSVLNKGQLIFTGRINEVNEEQIIEISSDDVHQLHEALQKFTGILKMETEGNIILVALPSKVQVSELSRFIFARNIAITHLVNRKKSLESQFLEILNEKA